MAALTSLASAFHGNVTSTEVQLSSGTEKSVKLALDTTPSTQPCVAHESGLVVPFANVRASTLPFHGARQSAR